MNREGDTDGTREEKRRLRKSVAEAVQRISTAERRSADLSIQEKVWGLMNRLGRPSLSAYLAMKDEACVDGLLARALEDGRAVYLPRVCERGMDLAPWRPSMPLARDTAGVLAPCWPMHGGVPTQSDTEQDWIGTLISERGVVVVPGRALDVHGGRLGRGGGYFDRLLTRAAAQVTVVGVGYEAQIVTRVPREPHDRAVDWIVTESRCAKAEPERPNHSECFEQ